MPIHLHSPGNPKAPHAPPLQVSAWLNTAGPVTLASLRGQVVVLHAFQMLCPGCVTHGLPQVARLLRTFEGDPGLAVLGLHTVFEHHAVMTPPALQVFIDEYRLRLPIGIDQPDPAGPVPLTMQAYGLQGTPSLLLIDRAGRLRLNHFGQIDDLALGALVGSLLAETPPLNFENNTSGKPTATPPAAGDAACDTGGCARP